MKTFTLQEAQKFLVAVAKDKYGLVFELALLTGMRPEEYLGLQWGVPSSEDESRDCSWVNSK